MTASLTAAVLVLVITDICGDDASLRCPHDPPLSSGSLETKKRQSQFYAILRPHPPAAPANAGRETNTSSMRRLEGVTPNTSRTLDTNRFSLEETSVMLEDFRFEYSPPLARAARFRSLPDFNWLRSWRLEDERGLFYNFSNRGSRIALCYSDIFQVRRNPDKGGHGPSIFFQLDLGKSKSSLRRRSTIFR